VVRNNDVDTEKATK